MKQTLKIEGQKVALTGVDLNNDGIISEVETISPKFDSGLTNIQQPTELGESIKEINEDSIDPKTRMSGIDLRANLHAIEVSSILAMDALVGFKVCPSDCLSFTRQKKRLSVSIGGRGRDDIVNIVSGKTERDAKMGFGEKVKGFMGMGGGKNE